MFIEGFAQELEKLSGNWTPVKQDPAGSKGTGSIAPKVKLEGSVKFKPFLRKVQQDLRTQKKSEYFRFE